MCKNQQSLIALIKIKNIYLLYIYIYISETFQEFNFITIRANLL